MCLFTFWKKDIFFFHFIIISWKFCVSFWLFFCNIFLSLSFCCCNREKPKFVRWVTVNTPGHAQTLFFVPCSPTAENIEIVSEAFGLQRWILREGQGHVLVEFGCFVHSLDGLFLTTLRVPSTSLSIFSCMEILTPIDVYNFTIRFLLLMILSNQIANRWNLVEKCAFLKPTMATNGNILGKHMRSKKQNVYFLIVLLEANLRQLGLIHHPERLPWWDFGRGVKEFLFFYPNPFEEFFKSNLSVNNLIWLNSGLKPLTTDDLFPSFLDSSAESLSNGRKRTGAEGEICHGGWVGKIH